MAFDAVEEEEEKKQAEEKASEAEDNGLEDGAYAADNEVYDEKEPVVEESSDDDATYEADTVEATTYVVAKDDGDGAYEEDRARSYSGYDGEYEADGDNVASKRAAKDADAEYGLADDHVFDSKKKTIK